MDELDAFLEKKGLKEIDYHGVDQAWGFRENEPIIAVIRDKSGQAFNAAMNLYWASADYISKPWCLLLDETGIAPHQKTMLDKLAAQYNIRLISNQDWRYETENQLNKLKEMLSEYIPSNSLTPVKDLGESIKKWRTEKPAHEYAYRLNIETGNLDIYREQDKLIPSRKTIPLTAASMDKRIDGILPRLTDTGNGLFFDTEHRNLPIVFKIHISAESTLSVRFEADKGNIIEATAFWSLFNAFNNSKRLAFIEQNTGDILFNCLRN